MALLSKCWVSRCFSDLFGLGVTCLHLLTNVESFTLYDVLENEYQWREFLNGKVVSDEFGKLLDQMTAYRVKERPSSITEIFLDLGIREKVSNPVSNSGVYSFKAEEIKSRISGRVSIPRVNSTQQPKSSNNTSSKQNIAKSPVELQSARGIDYSDLENLLKNKEWLKADQLTARLMCRVTGREKEGFLNLDSIHDFPSEDLRTIDQLWVYYSHNKFGFSIQKKLWIECGGGVSQYTHSQAAWVKFATKTGWYDPQKQRV